MKKIVLLSLIFALIFVYSSLNAQINRKGTSPGAVQSSKATIGITDLTSGATADDMVLALLGTGVAYSNVNFQGDPTSAGFFTNGLNAGLQINEGIMLTSGSLFSALGPNESTAMSVITGTPGDPELTAISGSDTFDASILEFDFVPTENMVSFSFIFASEEYPEWVGSQYNDVFAFFLNGQNIAHLPGTSTEITINNVNDISNSIYYVDNNTDPTLYDIEPDGFLVRIFLEGQVNPGATNHIKFAVADAGDQVYDSWVFLKAGSFASGNQPPEPDDFPLTMPSIQVDEFYYHEVEFHAPEYEQTTDVVVYDGGLPGFYYQVTPGNPATVYFELIGQPDNIGVQTIQFVATDNGTPPLSTTVNFQIEVTDGGGGGGGSKDQRIELPQGWSGISSYIIPDDPALDVLFSDVIDYMIIMQNNVGFFWPSQGINTLIAWDSYSGYAVKMTEDTAVIFGGSEIESQIFNVPAGWSYLPVHSKCEVTIDEVLSGFPEIDIIKDVAENGVYWPEYGINTIENLVPGMAYLIRSSAEISFTLPTCVGKSVTNNHQQPKANPSPWVVSQSTPNSHLIGFDPKALTTLMRGDVIGVFTQDGVCAGLTEIINPQEANYIAVFGKDETDPTNQGFSEGENFVFKLYRPMNAMESEIMVVFDEVKSNDLKFATNGITIVKEAKLKSQQINDLVGMAEMEISPNPAETNLTLHLNNLVDEQVKISIINPIGKVIYSQETFVSKTDAKVQINCSSFAKGVYLVTVSGRQTMITDKLVIK